MNNKLGRKVLHGVVMFSMVLSLAPAFSGSNVANAAVATTACADLKSGDFIKVEGKPAIFGVGEGKKVRFWAGGWYVGTRFQENKAQNISMYKAMGYKYVVQGCPESLPQPGVAPMLIPLGPGTEVFTWDEFPQWYVRLPGAIAPISQATAKALYGSTVKPMKVALDQWAHVAVCKKNELTDATMPHAGQVIKVGSTMYWVNYGKKLHEITANGMSANNLVSKYVRTWPASVMDKFTMGEKVDAYMAMIGNVHQQGWDCNADPMMGAWTQPSDQGPTNPTSTPITGDVTVNLNSALTPRAGDVPKNGSANFTAFTLTAGNSDVKVKELTVTRTGNSGTSDIENVRVVDEMGVTYGNIVSSLNSNHTGKIVFTTPLEVKAGQIKTYYIRAGVPSGATTGNTIMLGIANASDVVTESSNVRGSFPVVGNAMSVIGTTIGSVTFAADGTTTDETPDAGDKSVVVNKFKVTAGSTEDVTIENMSFLESGTAALTDYANLELFDVTNNKSLGKVSSWGADGKVHFTGLNLKVEKGKTIRFEVKTDVVSGAGLTMNVDLVDGSTVLSSVKGNTYGYYITPSVDNSWDGKGSNSQTINAGALTISLSSKSPGTNNISAGDNILLGVFQFEAKGEPVLVSAVTLTFEFAGMTYDEIRNVVLKDENAKLVAGPGSLTNVSSATGTVTLSDTFTVPAGQHTYSVYATLANTVSTNDVVRVKINAASSVTAKTFNTGTSVTAGGSFAVAAASSTVKGATLTATTLALPAARNVVQGAQDLVWMTGALSAANSGEDVVVTTIVLRDAPSASATDVQNVELWADLTTASSTRGDAYETLVSDTNNTWTSSTTSFTLKQKITVPKDKEVRIAVVADLSRSAASASTHAVKFDTDAGDVSGYGAYTGNTVNATPTGSGQTFTVSSGGTLTLSVDADLTSSTAQIAYAGEIKKTVLQLRLAANNVESLDLDSIKLTDDGDDTAAQTYYFYVGDKLLGTAAGAGTAEIFVNDNTQMIPADGYVVVTVKADMAPATAIGTGKTIDLAVAASGDVKTSGQASSVNSTVLASGPATYVVKSYPRIDFVDDSGKAISSNVQAPLIAGSNKVVARLAITAVGTKDVSFTSSTSGAITFSVSANNASNTAGTFTLVDESSGQTLDTVSQAPNTASLTFDFTLNSLVIPAGGTKYVKVLAPLGGFTTGGNNFQLWLDDASASNLVFASDGAGTATNYADILFRGDKYGVTYVTPST